MATDTRLEKRVMLEAFKQKANPTLFLSQWFRTTERDIFRSRKAVIDIKRNLEEIAVDIVRGTNGRLNNNKRFTTKEYIPPIYDEYMAYNEEELNERMPGDTEYVNPEYVSQFLAILTDDQIELRDLILRAIEKQAADTLVTGVVPLINGDTIDYKQKATHNFAANPVWSNSGGLPIGDFITSCELNRKDGKVNTGDFVALFGSTAYENFLLRNEGAGLRFDVRNAKLADITQPVRNTSGASFHGTFSAGSWALQIWTYPQYYKVPTGYGLPNEGTLVPYIPDDKVIVIPAASAIDLRLLYAGIPSLVRRVDPRLQAIGLDRVPANIRTDFHPYAHVDNEANDIKVGVRSAPLTVPTQIDGWTVIKTEG